MLHNVKTDFLYPLRLGNNTWYLVIYIYFAYAWSFEFLENQKELLYSNNLINRYWFYCKKLIKFIL